MNSPEQSLLKTSVDDLFVMCVEKFDRCSVTCTKLLQFFATFAFVYCIHASLSFCALLLCKCYVYFCIRIYFPTHHWSNHCNDCHQRCLTADGMVILKATPFVHLRLILLDQ